MVSGLLATRQSSFVIDSGPKKETYLLLYPSVVVAYVRVSGPALRECRLHTSPKLKGKRELVL
jgi:hypothetical protein